IQGDYSWTDAESTSPDALNSPFFFGGVSNRSRIDSLASVTGRLGYSWGSFLGYVRGGGAWEEDRYEIFDAFGPLATTANHVRSGWTVGVGGEYAFTPWLSGFAEYNFYDFGTKSHDFVTPRGRVFDVVDIEETKSVVKVGLNFRFGAGGPLYARY
ncbi:MAG TPA: outer membrane beta-barrel protein, partial [Gammaproteobacteria bacterium]|nr:outer membrane beta-barrel protein [Gammaproteobacteria bacterium]